MHPGKLGGVGAMQQKQADTGGGLLPRGITDNGKALEVEGKGVRKERASFPFRLRRKENLRNAWGEGVGDGTSISGMESDGERGGEVEGTYFTVGYPDIKGR